MTWNANVLDEIVFVDRGRYLARPGWGGGLLLRERISKPDQLASMDDKEEDEVN